MKIEMAQYIAGLIEADGTIHWYQHGEFKQLGLAISSSDINFLKKIVLLTSDDNLMWKLNCGTKKRYTFFPGGKNYDTPPNYQLKLYHYPSIKILLTFISPYLYGLKSCGLGAIFEILDLYKVRGKKEERAKLFKLYQTIQDNAEERLDVPPSSWMAGFLDGDGTISINGFVSIFNSDIQMLKVLKRYLDLGSYKYHAYENVGGCVSYVLKSKSRYFFLKEIEPYLIYKKDKAVRLLERLESVETICSAPVNHSMQDEDIVRPVWRHTDVYRNIYTPS